MKEIRAYIQPFMLAKLTQALMEIPDFPGMNVSDCAGFGQEIPVSAREYSPFMPRKRIEIFASDEMVEQIYNTIITVANTHQPGAGEAYIMAIEKSISIRSDGNPKN